MYIYKMTVTLFSKGKCIFIWVSMLLRILTVVDFIVPHQINFVRNGELMDGCMTELFL